jgi:hypothetical protein
MGSQAQGQESSGRGASPKVEESLAAGSVEQASASFRLPLLSEAGPHSSPSSGHPSVPAGSPSGQQEEPEKEGSGASHLMEVEGGEDGASRKAEKEESAAPVKVPSPALAERQNSVEEEEEGKQQGREVEGSVEGQHGEVEEEEEEDDDDDEETLMTLVHKSAFKDSTGKERLLRRASTSSSVELHARALFNMRETPAARRSPASKTSFWGAAAHPDAIYRPTPPAQEQESQASPSLLSSQIPVPEDSPGDMDVEEEREDPTPTNASSSFAPIRAPVPSGEDEDLALQADALFSEGDEEGPAQKELLRSKEPTPVPPPVDPDGGWLVARRPPSLPKNPASAADQAEGSSKQPKSRPSSSSPSDKPSAKSGKSTTSGTPCLKKLTRPQAYVQVGD